MKTHGALIGPHLQAFFSEHLCNHKRASAQTIASCRDSFRLLLRDSSSANCLAWNIARAPLILVAAGRSGALATWRVGEASPD
jgi:hypothetical protein